jgi:hypothetical protein
VLRVNVKLITPNPNPNPRVMVRVGIRVQDDIRVMGRVEDRVKVKVLFWLIVNM